MDTQVQDEIRTSSYINTGERTSTQVQSPEDTGVRTGDASPAVNAGDSGMGALFESKETADLRARWDKIQVEFVDEPRRSVEQADQLVGTVTQRLTEIFKAQRDRLEQEWDKGEMSTEELRMAFRRYRSLFDRLLSI
ncbi:MAG TPA: hypothetical protein VKX49_03025 [Bryobacteraceae bacterium]|nr:hypothetical protein [Bryobacteraceae bacterium]